MQLGDKKLIVQRASIGSKSLAPNLPTQIQVASHSLMCSAPDHGVIWRCDRLVYFVQYFFKNKIFCPSLISDSDIENLNGKYRLIEL